MELTADLDPNRSVAATQSDGHSRDRANARRNVLSLAAVTPGERPHQPPVLVDQADGDPVVLGLHDVGQGVVPETSGQPVMEGAELGCGSHFGETEHGSVVRVLRQFAGAIIGNRR